MSTTTWTDSDPAAAELTAADLEAARRRVAGLARLTPLVASDTLAERAGVPVFLKCENLQAGGAFKMRGAAHFMARLGDGGDRPRGVVTYSSGNHAIAVALAARRAGVPAVVVMPKTAPAAKRDRVAALGAEIHEVGPGSLERLARAEEIREARGFAMVPPFDHPWIVAGQATCGLEILDALPEASMLIAPVGGGGLLAGLAVACAARSPRVRVFGVEPEGAACMKASLDAGRPVTLATVGSIADGLLPSRPGDLTVAIASRLAAGVVTVPDDAIREAARLLLSRDHLLVEWSGAVGAAALLTGAIRPESGPVVVVLSGGNVDPARILEGAPPGAPA